MRFGLIGYGKWGQAHANALEKGKDSELVAVAVPSENSREAVKRDHPVDVYADYREMLDRTDLDAVDIVGPNYLHKEMAIAALNHNYDLILEKPMAATKADCDEILALAHQKNRLIAIPHESRYSPLWGGVKRLIEEGKIGKPLYVMVELWRRPFREGASGWKQDQGRVLSWFHEEPIHFFDLARWYLSELGEPTRLYAKGSSKEGEDSPLHDNMTAVLDFPGGAYALITQSIAAWGHSQTIKVAGTKGAITASWIGAGARATNPFAQLVYFDGNEAQEIPLEKGLSQMEELDLLIQQSIQAFTERKEPPVSGKDGRASAMLCEACLKSIESGNPVNL